VSGRRSTARGAGKSRNAADGPGGALLSPPLPSVATALDSRCQVCNRLGAESSRHPLALRGTGAWRWPSTRTMSGALPPRGGVGGSSRAWHVGGDQTRRPGSALRCCGGIGDRVVSRAGGAKHLLGEGPLLRDQVLGEVEHGSRASSGLPGAGGCQQLGVPHATCWYSLISPPSRSCRRTWWISVVVRWERSDVPAAFITTARYVEAQARKRQCNSHNVFEKIAGSCEGACAVAAGSWALLGRCVG
jgi:hypothetical protein